MIEQEKDALRDHEFDGIREYDNPTPGWWYLIFLGTFLFSIWYFLFYHASTISTSVAAGFQSAVSDDLRKQFSEIGELSPDEATLVRFLHDPKWTQVGQSVFRGQCVSCHGPEGAGVIGPNLTDDVYKNVKTLQDVAKVISDGAANGAMPAWKTRLHRNEVVLVAAYVAGMRGKNLASARTPEGVAIPAWPSAPAVPATGASGAPSPPPDGAASPSAPSAHPGAPSPGAAPSGELPPAR